MDTQKSRTNETAEPSDYDTTLTPFHVAPPRTPRGKPNFGWGDRIALVIMAVVVLSMLYPVWMQNDTRTRGVVWDENSRPIPGAVLEVRDSAGRVLRTVTADAQGEVLWNRAWSDTGTTFGKYGIARWMRSTGARGHIYLAPLVLHRVRVRNALTGTAPEPVGLVVNPESRTYYRQDGFKEGTYKTSATGEFNIGTLPATARMRFACENVSLTVWNVIPAAVQRKEPPYQTEIVYDVTVIPTGTVSGRVVSIQGTPIYSADVRLQRMGATIYGADELNPRDHTTDENGTFRFAGLMPGRYKLGCARMDGSETRQEVSVISGQDTAVRIEGSTFSPSPLLPPVVHGER